MMSNRFSQKSNFDGGSFIFSTILTEGMGDINLIIHELHRESEATTLVILCLQSK